MTSHTMHSHVQQRAFSFCSCQFVCSGSFGGIRSGLALRPFLLELGSVSVPAILTIPQANKAIDEAGKPSSEQEERLNKNAKRLIDQVRIAFTVTLPDAMNFTSPGESQIFNSPFVSLLMCLV